MDNKMLARVTVEEVLLPLVFDGSQSLPTRVGDATSAATADRIVAACSSIRELVKQALVLDDEVALLGRFDVDPRASAQRLEMCLEHRFAANPSFATEVDGLLARMTDEWPGVMKMIKEDASASPFDMPASASVSGFMPTEERIIVDRLLRDSKGD